MTPHHPPAFLMIAAGSTDPALHGPMTAAPEVVAALQRILQNGSIGSTELSERLGRHGVRNRAHPASGWPASCTVSSNSTRPMGASRGGSRPPPDTHYHQREITTGPEQSPPRPLPSRCAWSALRSSVPACCRRPLRGGLTPPLAYVRMPTVVSTPHPRSPVAKAPARVDPG